MKKIILLFTFSFIISIIIRSADIPVASGGDINAAITGASNNDVIVLDDGGTYTVLNTIVLDKTITISAADGYTTQPTVNISPSTAVTTTSTGAGIAFKGLNIGGPGGSSYFIVTAGGDSITHVKFIDTELHDFGRCAIRSSNADTYLGEIMVENCHFHDFTASTWRIFWIRHNDINQVSLTNSTFNNFTESVLYIDGDDPGATNIRIDKITVDGKPTIDGNPIFNFIGTEGGNVNITNSIFTNLESDTALFVIGPEFADSISNSRFYFVGNTIDTNNFWSYKSDFIEADPMYADAANNDFSLGNDDFLTAAIDGGILGDPRWLPTLPDGLIAWWKLDEETGSDVIDKLGTSNGTMMNMADSLRVDGLLGKAIDYTKAVDSGYINVDDNEIVDFDSTESFSISVLVKIDDISSGTDQNIIFKGNVSNDINGHWYGLIFKSNELRFAVDDKVKKSQLAFTNANLAMNMEGWNHIVGVRDRVQDSLFIYLNGEKVAALEDLTELNISSAPLPLIIGNNPEHNRNFQGAIDEIQMYNKVLSAKEIYDLADNYGVIPQLSDNNNLDGITFDPEPISLTPIFNAAVTNYEAVFAAGTDSVTVSATTEDVSAIVSGTGNVDLTTGSNAIDLTVTAENGSMKSYHINMTVTVGINDTYAGNINIYPNPVLNKLTITNLEVNDQVNIYDINGVKRISYISKEYGNDIIDVSLLNEGIYHIQVIHNKKVFGDSYSFIKK